MPDQRSVRVRREKRVLRGALTTPIADLWPVIHDEICNVCSNAERPLFSFCGGNMEKGSPVWCRTTVPFASFPFRRKLTTPTEISEGFDCLWRSPYCHVCSPGWSYCHIMMSRMCNASSRLKGPMLVR